MHINSVSLNFYKPQIKQNTSFGKYDRKYSWCQENPLISKEHPAIYSPENIKFDNLEQTEDMLAVIEKVKIAKRIIEETLSLRADFAGKEMVDVLDLGRAEVSKTTDNKVKSYTITNADGRKTTVKFGQNEEIFVAKGIKDRGSGIVEIREFYYFDKYCDATPRFVKYYNFMAIGSACTFDKAFTCFDGKSFTFYPDINSNTLNAANRYNKFQQI